MNPLPASLLLLAIVVAVLNVAQHAFDDATDQLGLLLAFAGAVFVARAIAHTANRRPPFAQCRPLKLSADIPCDSGVRRRSPL